MLQRGKGGGLAGPWAAGGQSAFGTKAGDLFTKITVGVASFWILISVFAAIYAPYLSANQIAGGPNAGAQQNPGRDPTAAGKAADSAAGKAGRQAAGRAGYHRQGSQGSGPAGKPTVRSRPGRP